MNILPTPPLNVVLVEPQIPPNTGSIARLCAAVRCHLILTGTLGFELSDRYLRRAGLDYWEWVSWEHIENTDDFVSSLNPERCHFLTTKTDKPYTQMKAAHGDHIFFGKETEGLPAHLRERFPERCFTIPMWEPNVRSLNLASAASIVVYDALRHLYSF